METYKTPLEQSSALLKKENHPFDLDHLSFKDSHDTARTRFDKSRLVNLTSDEYYKLVANENNQKWQDLVENRRNKPNEISVNDMAKMMREGSKFPTPFIHLSDKLGNIPHFQEGLHRMLAASDVYGKDARFPVWLGYDADSIEDFEGIDKGNIDEWIQTMNDKRRQNQIDYDNAEYEKELAMEEYYKNETAKFFNIPVDQVTPEKVKKYKRYEDWLFKEDFD